MILADNLVACPGRNFTPAGHGDRSGVPHPGRTIR